MPGFTRFLEVCALANGDEISYTNISSDSGVKVKTVEAYFQILQDTLIGFLVPAFRPTKKRKAITRSKHFFFDIGVVNNLTRRGRVELRSELFGNAFEHFMALELRAYLSYSRIDEPLQYWRSTSQFEVDFVIGYQLAIEVKGTDHIVDKHLKGLRALTEENLVAQFCVVSLDTKKRITADGITIWPYQEFLRELWADRIFLLSPMLGD